MSAVTPHRPHIIFDFGAVLFRWEPLRLLQELFPHHADSEVSARALSDRIFKGFTGAWGQFDAGTVSREDLAPMLAEQSGLSAAQMLALIDAIPPHLHPLPDSVALLDDLQAAGHRLFYLSNMPASYADYLEAQHPVVQRFEDGVFSARVGLTKPDPAIFLHAVAQFGVAASDCVFLDDHAANVATARALGMGAVHFSHAAQARQELLVLGVLAA